MDEKKLTDEELIKRSECLNNYWKSFMLDIIARKNEIIAEQKAEIEQLTEERTQIQACNSDLLTENAELQKQVDKAWLEVGKMCMEERKDTAKEILQILKAYDEEDYFQELEKAIAKRYGVEVK